jgi:hypothetical protein
MKRERAEALRVVAQKAMAEVEGVPSPHGKGESIL